MSEINLGQVVGPRGFQGIQGVKGDKGDQGIQGEVGPQVDVAASLGNSTVYAVSQKLLTDEVDKMTTTIATIKSQSDASIVKADNADTKIDTKTSELLTSILGINKKLTDRINTLEESNIYEMFDNNNGIWLDPSDLKTMFQTVGGASLPVTKDGDPVGLMLDKSQGLEGAVTNVAKPFKADSSNDYLDVTNTSDGTKLVVKSVSNQSSFHIFEVGKTYSLSVVYSIPETASNISAYNTNSGANNFLFTATKGVRNKAEVTLTARSSNIYFRTSSGEITIHEIVLKEIKGNHASQPLAASRPTYRTDGVLHWLEFDGVDDYLLTTGTFNAKNLFISALVTQSTSGLIARTTGTAYILRTASGYWYSNVGGGVFYVGYRVGNKDIFTFNTSLDGNYVRLNSVVVANRPANSFDMTAPYFIGSSVVNGNTNSPLNGNIYGVIAVDSLMSNNKLFTTEQYIQRKAGVEI